MLPLSSFGRAFVLLLAFAAPAALAQTTPSPYIDKDDATTYEADVLTTETSQEIDAAVAEALRAAAGEVASETAPEDVLDLREELRLLEAQSKNADGSFGTIDAETVAAMEAAGIRLINPSAGTESAAEARSSGPRLVGKPDRTYTLASVQTYPIIPDGYGMDGDGFPSRMAISGTIVDAGSLRICRFDAPPVSRWLRIRLSDTSATYPGEQIVVAVQCHEDKKELLVGRRVRMEVWKSIAGRPIRMATDDVPSVGTPMYESYPGNVRLGG